MRCPQTNYLHIVCIFPFIYVGAQGPGPGTEMENAGSLEPGSQPLGSGGPEPGPQSHSQRQSQSLSPRQNNII